MNWQVTNNSINRDWETRTTTTFCRQGDPSGVAYEYIAALSNAAHSDPWICIPHLATDDYVIQLAHLMRDRLDPDRKVYVEYSNEVWNSQFQQYSWVIQNIQADHNPSKYAIIARQKMNLFRDSFGDASRVVRVLAGQRANPWVLSTAADAISGDCDAMSCAAYLGMAPTGLDGSSTLTQLYTMYAPSITAMMPGLQGNRDVATRYAKRFVTYEGGQDLTPNPIGTTPPYLPLFKAFQRDPRMELLSRQLLNNVFSVGASLSCHYKLTSVWNQWGFYGALEFQDEDLTASLKYRALKAFSHGGP
jgi:hypothetical protein